MTGFPWRWVVVVSVYWVFVFGVAAEDGGLHVGHLFMALFPALFAYIAVGLDDGR